MMSTSNGKRKIYVAQLGSGSNINLLPLSAGVLVSSLSAQEDIREEYAVQEILFQREDPQKIVSRLEDPAIIGFSCHMWNNNHSLAVAREAKKRFPQSAIVVGGSSAVKEPGVVESFLEENKYIDFVCVEEGEQVFVDVCRSLVNGTNFQGIEGLIYRDPLGRVLITNPAKPLPMKNFPSPYLDGTFDALFEKFRAEISGTIIETNRGCPFKCGFCGWGADFFNQVREKPTEVLKEELEWIGKRGIGYLALADANFGIRPRDLEFAEMLAKTKEKYGVPKFLSVSWVKNQTRNILTISDTLRKADIGFRITSAVQSLHGPTLKASQRHTISAEAYAEIRETYRKSGLYSYTELILGLPEETRETFMSGLEASLNPSVFDQVYAYLHLLYANTDLSSQAKRKLHGFKSSVIECSYTKSRPVTDIREDMEIIWATHTMPKEEWVDTFVHAYATLALHDDRIAFFPLNWMKKEFGIPIIDVVKYAQEQAVHANRYPLTRNMFTRLETTARGIQDKAADYLIRPVGYGGIPYDPPEGVFLELMLDKKDFLAEFLSITKSYLERPDIKEKYRVRYHPDQLSDVFTFQDAVMASPLGRASEHVDLKYDWPKYFRFTFNLDDEPLEERALHLNIVERKPSYGNPRIWRKNYFDIRGVPAFDFLYDERGEMVFPPIPMQHVSGVVNLGTEKIIPDTDIVLRPTQEVY